VTDFERHDDRQNSGMIYNRLMVRTRIAPSPTGYMHIGNLRTGLYAYCIARQAGGCYILRIEDTDRKRHNPKAIRVIYDSLRMAGLEYDEGPDVGGKFGPYIQSQRKEQGIYRQYAELLVERGGAYRCFCAKPENSKELRGKKPKMNPCRFLSPEEIQARIAAGQPYVIRQRIPDPEQGVTTFDDLVFGTITIRHSQLDDQILLKSDDYPTYNFANVVDDHQMKITHVVRGLEYLSSTPKYNLLYQSFGWEIPVYIHLPHIIKENGKKLSKREGDASFQDLMAAGFIPQAIMNMIVLLGWNPGDGHEVFTLDELVSAFDVRHISKSKAAFSIAKLEWLNGEHIRKLPPQEFHRLAEKFYPAEFAQQCDIQLTSQVIQPRVTRLTKIPGMTRFLLEVPAYEASLFEHSKSKSSLDSSRAILKEVAGLLSNIEGWCEPQIREVIMAYATEKGYITSTVMWPVRVALSGLAMTPGGATEIAAILKQTEALRRIQVAVQKLE
jgi:glutamyl-tRNA synthetase